LYVLKNGNGYENGVSVFRLNINLFLQIKITRRVRKVKIHHV